MDKSRVTIGALLLGIFILAACSKANSPTNSHFETAIKNYMHKHPDFFAIHPEPIPPQVMVNDDQILCGNILPDFPSPCSNFSFNRFMAIKNAGFYVQSKTVPSGKYVTKPNPNYSTELAKYNKNMGIYKKSMSDFNRKMAIYNAKVEQVDAEYNKKLNKLLAEWRRKGIWCVNHAKFGQITPNWCFAFIQQSGGTASNVTNNLVFQVLREYSPVYPNMYPALPTRGQYPNLPNHPILPKRPNKFINVQKMYPIFTASGPISIGKYEFSKIISASQPAADLMGAIVSQVKFSAKPKLSSNANLFPKDPSETTIKVFTIRLVQQTQGWSGEGQDGGLVNH